MIDRRFVALLVCSALIIGMVLFGASQVRFDLPLSPRQKAILGFNYQKAGIKDRQPLMASGLKSPVEAGTPAVKGYPAVKLSEVAPPAPAQVSLVVIRGEKKIAVIDGLVVKEGDTVNQGRVVRIEKNGVLVKSKEGERWFKIN